MYDTNTINTNINSSMKSISTLYMIPDEASSISLYYNMMLKFFTNCQCTMLFILRCLFCSVIDQRCQCHVHTHKIYSNLMKPFKLFAFVSTYGYVLLPAGLELSPTTYSNYFMDLCLYGMTQCNC